jgi:peroxiredoxin
MKKTFSIFAVIAALFLSTSWIAESGVQLNDTAPNFNLKGVDDKMVELNKLETKGAIVIFTCNHCPYAKAYEDRIIALHSKYKKSYPVIAINPNDAVAYPDDSFSAMIERAEEKGFTFPYLHDESQATAKAYGALKTPHVYLLKKENGVFKVKYIGAIDNNTYNPEQVTKKYLENAIADLEAGKNVSTATTKAIGCGIKWK